MKHFPSNWPGHWHRHDRGCNYSNFHSLRFRKESDYHHNCSRRSEGEVRPLRVRELLSKSHLEPQFNSFRSLQLPVGIGQGF